MSAACLLTSDPVIPIAIPADKSRGHTAPTKQLSNAVLLKLIHTATPDTTKLSCLCRVSFGGVNWIHDNSRLSSVTDKIFEV